MTETSNRMNTEMVKDASIFSNRNNTKLRYFVVVGNEVPRSRTHNARICEDVDGCRNDGGWSEFGIFRTIAISRDGSNEPRGVV
jgi:hypothetical protein